MCRIAGIIDKQNINLAHTIAEMRDSMAHGGPDHAGIYTDDAVRLALGHRRLSIIDLSENGNQPMQSNDGKLIIAFNGEIYNFRELRDELKDFYSFHTHSDTEVILAAYTKWGVRCFPKLKGMFALALYDLQKGEIVLARDPSGIKPLYYSITGDSLYFASEVRAFKALKKWPERKDWKIYFLTYGFLPEPVTTLEGVQPLERGKCMVVNVHTLASKKETYWQDDYSITIHNRDEALNKVRTTLDDAVKRHLISDAPIGLFLSGGIDSSLLTLIADKVGTSKLHTLSIVFDDATYSEEAYQNIIAQKVNSDHKAFRLTKELYLEAMPDILNAMDQPTSDGVNTYFICKFAKEYGLKAVLSGLGADELFGGYASFSRGGMVNKLKNIPAALLNATEYLPQDKYKKISFLSRKDAVGNYLFNRGYFSTIETAQVLGTSSKEVSDKLKEICVPGFVNELCYENQTSYLERSLYMQGQLLKDTDMMSMWHSIEVRVPFLDVELVQLANHISEDIKFNGRPKSLLVDAYADILPREIWDRKKQGFVFPFQAWMNGKETSSFHIANKKMTDKYQAGKLNWSRYWTYLIANA
ncbi:MAG: asparagine synthase (glutamine-hydrolyzing) [Bacteroidetes bacterium]|nr:asparagine synthase (glutamine-hydrolyzing) [Bacteroidota bacterium]